MVLSMALPTALVDMYKVSGRYVHNPCLVLPFLEICSVCGFDVSQ